MSAQRPVDLDEMDNIARWLSELDLVDAEAVDQAVRELSERRARDAAVERLIAAVEESPAIDMAAMLGMSVIDLVDLIEAARGGAK